MELQTEKVIDVHHGQNHYSRFALRETEDGVFETVNSP